MKTTILKKTLATFREIIKYNNIRAITDLVEMYSSEGVLHIGSTDNHTTIIATIPNENDFDNCIVSLNFLNNLVKLTTTEDIKLSVITKVRKKDSVRFLEFKGNGKYNIPIQTDENGEDFFLPLFSPPHGDMISIVKHDIEHIVKRNGFSILDSEDSLNLYHFEEGRVITSDSFVVSCTKNQNLFSKDIPSHVMQVLNSVPSDFELSFVEDGIRVTCENCEIFIQYKQEEIFPIDMINPFLGDMDFIASFTVDKKELMQALKRQNLFKLAYENPTVVLNFGACVTLKNKQESTQEELVITNYKHDKHIDITFNTDVLLEVLKNMDNIVDFFLTEDVAKLVDNNGFYVISVADTM